MLAVVAYIGGACRHGAVLAAAGGCCMSSAAAAGCGAAVPVLAAAAAPDRHVTHQERYHFFREWNGKQLHNRRIDQIADF